VTGEADQEMFQQELTSALEEEVGEDSTLGSLHVDQEYSRFFNEEPEDKELDTQKLGQLYSCRHSRPVFDGISLLQMKKISSSLLSVFSWPSFSS
jgi:hypothetical protein